MKPSIRLRLWLSTVLVGLGLILGVGWFLRKKSEPISAQERVISRPPDFRERPPHGPETLGDQVLANYGQAGTDLESDLTLFKNFLTNVFLLEKQHDPRHYSTNEDLALYLLGRSPQATRYLSPESPLLNAQQQLIDRHGSLLIIHPLSRNRLEIRSAGPDRLPYTKDDVTR